MRRHEFIEFMINGNNLQSFNQIRSDIAKEYNIKQY